MKFVFVINQAAQIVEAYNLKMAKSAILDTLYTSKEVGSYEVYKCITQKSKPSSWVSVEGIWGYDADAMLQGYEAVYKTHEVVNTQVIDNYSKIHEACLWLSMQEGVESGNYYEDGGYFTVGGAVIRVKDHNPRGRGWESSMNIIVDGTNRREESYIYTTFKGLLEVVKDTYETIKERAIAAGTYNKNAESNPKYILRNLISLAQKRIPKPLDKPQFVVLSK